MMRRLRFCCSLEFIALFLLNIIHHSRDIDLLYFIIHCLISIDTMTIISLTQAEAAGQLSIPPELLNMVCTYLSRPTLEALAQTCKWVCSPATSAIWEEVSVTEESMRHLNRKAGDHISLFQKIKRFFVELHEDECDWITTHADPGMLSPEWDIDLPESKFIAAETQLMRLIVSMANLQSLHIQYDWWYADYDHMWWLNNHTNRFVHLPPLKLLVHLTTCKYSINKIIHI